ncbi:hypothetical protein [Methylococcus sp. Mc7]|uniref:hypothetical protein n=1 Tax=Methylococcus sp. Mc7 TaxID=2860258 RepID=UPI001C52DD9D|nr:hypothetical protein [Methylococcus sp. Mc7]QXP85483.1 hypothetical protein KW115_07170 [Methylococcus sp. Mc7]
MRTNLRHCPDCDYLQALPNGWTVCGFSLTGPALELLNSAARFDYRTPVAACAYPIGGGRYSTESEQIAPETAGLQGGLVLRRHAFTRTPPQCWDCPYYRGEVEKNPAKSCRLQRRQRWYWGPGDNLVIQADSYRCEPLFPYIDALREGIDRDTGELSPDYVEALAWFQEYDRSLQVQAARSTALPAGGAAQAKASGQFPASNRPIPFRRPGANTRTPDRPAVPKSA